MHSPCIVDLCCVSKPIANTLNVSHLSFHSSSSVQLSVCFSVCVFLYNLKSSTVCLLCVLVFLDNLQLLTMCMHVAIFLYNLQSLAVYGSVVCFSFFLHSLQSLTSVCPVLQFFFTVYNH